MSFWKEIVTLNTVPRRLREKDSSWLGLVQGRVFSLLGEFGKENWDFGSVPHFLHLGAGCVLLARVLLSSPRASSGN
jgi:hypothetical protein